MTTTQTPPAPYRPRHCRWCADGPCCYHDAYRVASGAGWRGGHLADDPADPVPSPGGADWPGRAAAWLDRNGGAA
jgi:hypothetical protein